MSTSSRSRRAFLICGSFFFVGAVYGDPETTSKRAVSGPAKEATVFVTGSLIPQRVQLRSIGTLATSPLRIIDRREIDGTGRRTTAGALINEPSVRVLGN